MKQNNRLENRPRIGWIDIAKATGIFFIVLGHVSKADYRTNPLRLFCYSFNAQFFFILSGLTFLGVRELDIDYVKCRSAKEQIISWIKRLVCPYFLWGIVSILIYWLMGKMGFISEDYAILPNIIGMLYGNSTSDYFQWNRPLWFLPCLFCTSIFWLITVKFIARLENAENKNMTAYITGFTTVSLLVAGGVSVIGRTIAHLPWHLETVPYAYSFMGIGLLLKKMIPAERKKYVWGVVGIFLLIIGFAMGASENYTDLRQNEIDKYILFVFVSVTVSASFITVARLIGKCKILEYIGRRTMPILLMHKFPVLFFQMICPGIKTQIEKGNALVEIVSSILVIGMCIAVSYVIERIWPFCIGMSKRETQYKGVVKI